jgi:hypothetical protein
MRCKWRLPSWNAGFYWPFLRLAQTPGEHVKRRLSVRHLARTHGVRFSFVMDVRRVKKIAHIVRSHTCHNAHRVHILTLAEHAGRSLRGVAAIHAAGPEKKVPSARGVHDHEESISCLGSFGPALAAFGSGAGVCRRLRDAYVARDLSSSPNERGATGLVPVAPFRWFAD